MARKHKHSKAGTIVEVGLIAGAFGYLVGIFTSPRSGKQNRAKVKRVTKKSKRAALKELKKLHKELGKVVDQSQKAGEKLGKKAQGEYGLLVDKAANTKETVREVISAVKEGRAKNKDLDKAVEDARAAIDHAKDYIKKK